MGKKIIVAGGGHGGIAAGALLAAKGFDVTVYEKHTREDMGYDWTDIFDPKAITAIEMDFPDESKYNYKHDMTFYSPSFECKLKQHVPADQREIQMERKEIYNCLIDYAEKNGVKFEFSTEILAPVMLGNRVAGIKTDKGDFYADLVIDAAGMASPVRSNLPSYLGIQNNPGEFETFYVYRAFFERTAPIEEDDFKVILFFNNVLGISWVATEEKHTDVLIGRFAPFGEDEVERTITALRETQPALGEKIVRGGQFVKIPVRQPLAVMVADGYAAIGDSAFMTVPLIGSGIANTLKASAILADVVANDKNEAFSVETLYKYQKKFYEKLGSGLAPIAPVKLMLANIDAKDVEYLFKSGIINDDDITMGADATELSSILSGFNAESLKLKVKGLASNTALMKKILVCGKNIASAATVCAAMPKIYDRKALSLWAKTYNKCFVK